MKRCWNVYFWAGFIFVLAGLFTYIPFFALFPVTRDFPWANLLLLAVGLALMAVGLVRAFRQPQLYHGRIVGSALAALSLVLAGLFCWGTIYFARQLPASASAPRVGQKAPDFVLPDQDGKPVGLAELLASPTANGTSMAKPGGALLIFYRGYW